MKWQTRHSAALVIALLLVWACNRSNPFPDVPELTYKGISKDSLYQGLLNTDSIVVYFQFTDGDGDIGDLPGDTAPDLIVRDMRLQTEEYFQLPVVGSTTSGPISVEGSVRIYNTCCIYRDGTPPCSPKMEMQSLQYQITLRDRAGHISNAILTPPIRLLCN